MSEKQICIIAANCQGAYLKAILNVSPEFSGQFDVHYFVNYKLESVPGDLLKKCSLLIYHPLGPKWNDLSTEHLLGSVPKTCRTIAINYLTFPGYWPFFAPDPRNQVSHEYPFGPFPYGDGFIINKIAEGIQPEEIFDRYMSLEELLAFRDPNAVMSEYIEKQRDIELRRDQKLLDFIIGNFRQKKLFETFNHPSQYLCEVQTNDLLKMLGFPEIPAEKMPNLVYLVDNQQPIHPLLAKYMGVEFLSDQTLRYNIWKTPRTFAEYTRAYISWDLSAIGKANYDEEIRPKGPVCLQNERENVRRKKLEMKEAQQATAESPADAKAKAQPVVADEQIVFLHIPKTAGTSLNEMLAEAYGIQGKFMHYNSTLILVKDKERRGRQLILGHIHYDVRRILGPNLKMFTFLRDPVDRTISAFEFMKSHPETWLGQLAQGTIEEFLNHKFVQNSISDVQTRLIGLEFNLPSLYARLKRGLIDRDQYYATVQDLAQSEVTADMLERAMERIKKLFFVGFTELFSDDVKTLFMKLNKPCPEVRQSNRTPSAFRKRDAYSEAEIELIKARNSHDIALYDHARQLGEQGYWK